MKMEIFNNFSNSTKELAKNPLGIIALFILLVYGFACLLFGVTVEELKCNERMPIIYFTIGFPILVLGAFVWLVSKHHNKLYAPSDYKNDESFLSTISQTSKQESIKENIDDLLNYGKDLNSVKEQEKMIIDDLQRKGINNDHEKVNVLIHHLATEQIHNWFYRVYVSIFGSQIKLLEKLEVQLKYDLNSIHNYFNNVKEENIDAFKDWNTESYIAYLLNCGLIIIEDEEIKITEKGKDFIKILRISEYRNDTKGL
ncbi:hypothetical protein [Arcobacter roscoffensis]|uniref:Uncharacterized protein n=1 Tax=Arcobacter roscoffensis TaxID=2961520 RepID=A0ABY5DZK0_9BACT|nr:hypothetical protein [Arcobacter roscoffensis]UTJ05374.1 hypothetical protein NJU99_08845 [Arcobacter roscoffensis]